MKSPETSFRPALPQRRRAPLATPTDPIAERIRNTGGAALRPIRHTARSPRVLHPDAECLEPADSLAEGWIERPERRSCWLFETSRRLRPARRLGRLLLAAALGLAGPAAMAAPADAEALARHRQERAACLRGTAPQDRRTCLREADAALDEARRGGLGGDAAQYPAHRRQRCQVLPPGDREACLARMAGQGSTSGSVAGGGIGRDLVQRSPAPAGAGASAPAASTAPTPEPATPAPAAPAASPAR